MRIHAKKGTDPAELLSEHEVEAVRVVHLPPLFDIMIGSARYHLVAHDRVSTVLFDGRVESARYQLIA